jgi:lipopolysaccharide/colanic/teichoic acid biosynthesis glycosyltransferase
MILRSRTLYNILVGFDLLVMGWAFALATALHFDMAQPASIRDILLNIRIRFATILVLTTFFLFWHLILRFFGAYREAEHPSSRHEALNLCGAVLAGSLVLIVIAKALHSALIDSTFILVFYSMNTVLVVSGHFVTRYFFGKVWTHSHMLRRFVYPAYRDEFHPTQRREALVLCTLIIIVVMGILLAAKAGGIVKADLTFIIIFFALNVIAVICGHLITRMYIEKNGNRSMVRHLVIAGTNKRALALAKFFSSHPELGYRVIGFVDDVILAPELSGAAMPLTRDTAARLALSDKEPAGVKQVTPLLTNFENFGSFIRKQVVDEVILCLPILSFYKQSSQIVALCRDHGVTVNYASDLFDLKRSHQSDMEIINIYTGMLYTKTAAASLKRVTDVVGSLVGLVVALPVFAIIALLIKLTSKGPVFFTQMRIGWNKRKFKLYKFRTMVADAEEKIEEVAHLNSMEGPILKVVNDPRITPLGKWLRKTSLDELPQLINVLLGDMSLVGPRPLTLRDFQGFEIDWHHRRFSVRPGITCTWQVQGRSSIPFDKWMELDARYIDTWSFFTDIKILFKTIPAVLKAKGAE